MRLVREASSYGEAVDLLESKYEDLTLNKALMNHVETIHHPDFVPPDVKKFLPDYRQIPDPLLVVDKDGYKRNVLIWGDSGVGKSLVAKAWYPNYLFITDRQGLLKWKTGSYGGIIIDEFVPCPQLWRWEELLTLLDPANPTNVRILYTHVNIPERTQVILTSNLSLKQMTSRYLLGQKNGVPIGDAQGAAMFRRIVEFNLTESVLLNPDPVAQSFLVMVKDETGFKMVEQGSIQDAYGEVKAAVEADRENASEARRRRPPSRSNSQFSDSDTDVTRMSEPEYSASARRTMRQSQRMSQGSRIGQDWDGVSSVFTPGYSQGMSQTSKVVQLPFSERAAQLSAENNSYAQGAPLPPINAHLLVNAVPIPTVDPVQTFIPPQQKGLVKPMENVFSLKRSAPPDSTPLTSTPIKKAGVVRNLSQSMAAVSPGLMGPPINRISIQSATVQQANSGSLPSIPACSLPA